MTKHILLLAIFGMSFSTIYAQNSTDSLNNKLINNIAITQVDDSTEYTEIDEIRDRLQSFRDDNRSSHTLILSGVAFMAMAPLLNSQNLDNTADNFVVCGAFLSLVGYIKYVFSFENFNFKTPTSKKTPAVKTTENKEIK